MNFARLYLRGGRRMNTLSRGSTEFGLSSEPFRAPSTNQRSQRFGTFGRRLIGGTASVATLATIGIMFATNEVVPPAMPKTPLYDNINPRGAFSDQSALDLLRSYTVLQMCRLAPIAEPLVWVATKLRLGWLLEATFMRHFCAGHDANDIVPALNDLHRRNLLPILDVAVEADEDASKADPKCLARLRESVVFASASPGGCIAVKLTALVAPAALKRVSEALAVAAAGSRTAFAKISLWKQGGSSDIAAAQSAQGLGISKSDLDAIQELYSGLNVICEDAVARGVSVMVDAEQTYFQNAIDLVAINMAAKYNRTGKPVVYNTYQMYLKSGLHKLKGDLEAANAQGWAFASKIVRGAYMISERARAERDGYASPIHDTQQDTHTSYNSGINAVMDAMDGGQSTFAVIASHNIDSVSTAAQRASQSAAVREHTVFATLKGMQDVTSYALATRGLTAMKYMPYGALDEVLPYLIRRSQENSSMIGSSAIDKQLLSYELRSRLRECIKAQRVFAANDAAEPEDHAPKSGTEVDAGQSID